MLMFALVTRTNSSHNCQTQRCGQQELRSALSSVLHRACCSSAGFWVPDTGTLSWYVILLFLNVVYIVYMSMTLCRSHGHTENWKMREEKEMKEVQTNTKRNHFQLLTFLNDILEIWWSFWNVKTLKYQKLFISFGNILLVIVSYLWKCYGKKCSVAVSCYCTLLWYCWL